MRLSISGTQSIFQQGAKDLLKGRITRTVPTQTDQVDEVSFKDVKKNHRTSFRYNKDLEMNVKHVIDNQTGETVKKSHSDAEVDQKIRMKRLMKLHIDEKA